MINHKPSQAVLMTKTSKTLEIQQAFTTGLSEDHCHIQWNSNLADWIGQQQTIRYFRNVCNFWNHFCTISSKWSQITEKSPIKWSFQDQFLTSLFVKNSFKAANLIWWLVSRGKSTKMVCNTLSHQTITFKVLLWSRKKFYFKQTTFWPCRIWP